MRDGGSKHCVVKIKPDGGTQTEKCHDTHSAAEDHLTALRIAESETKSLLPTFLDTTPLIEWLSQSLSDRAFNSFISSIGG